MNKKMLLGISASPRARLSSRDYRIFLDRMTDYQKMYEVIYELSSEKRISNTEGLLLASLFGAKSDKVDIEAINLKDVFGSGKLSKDFLTDSLERCSGIIVGTPVYFGDRSSWFDMLINHLRENNINTENKIFGGVAVGAKRNGGQETTLIFGLLDALNLGFNVVGNGPPTSQFGGTGWAGDLGKIQDDNFGLDTSMGLGSRVRRYFEILSSKYNPKIKLKIGVLYSGLSGNDPRLIDLISGIENRGASVEILDVDTLVIKPCLGCSVCPVVPGQEYGCVLKDDMCKMRALSGLVDGLIFVLSKDRNKKEQYQMFLERTRFIRRDNFIMSDLPFGIYCIEDTFKGNHYASRMLMSFLRHNMFIISPLIQVMSDGVNTISNAQPEDMFSRLLFFAAKSSESRRKSNIRYSYKAIGYGAEGKG